MALILTMRFQDKEHQLTRSRGVAVITSPCHGEDRGFNSRRDRSAKRNCSNLLNNPSRQSKDAKKLVIL